MIQYLCVDIGGTQLRAACFSANNIEPLRILRSNTKASPSDDPKESTLDRLESLIERIWPVDDQIVAISVAAPGPVNPYSGILLEAPNIPGWENIPLRQILEDKFQIPVLLGNDANMAALGEWKYGAGVGHHHMIYLTVSTGIGGK